MFIAVTLWDLVLLHLYSLAVMLWWGPRFQDNVRCEAHPTPLQSTCCYNLFPIRHSFPGPHWRLGQTEVETPSLVVVFCTKLLSFEMWDLPTNNLLAFNWTNLSLRTALPLNWKHSDSDCDPTSDKVYITTATNNSTSHYSFFPLQLLPILLVKTNQKLVLRSRPPWH